LFSTVDTKSFANLSAQMGDKRNGTHVMGEIGGGSMRILALYCSARRGGNSELLLDRAVDGLPATRIYLSELAIDPIQDLRHDPAGFPPVDGPVRDLFEAMLSHDLLLFGCPIYWYGMPTHLKLLVDRWSQALRDPSLNFKERMRGKLAYVLLTGGDKPRVKGLPLVQQFIYALDFVGVEVADYIIGQGNKPGEILQDERAVAGADWLNKQLRAKLG
jgi:multimeric flavodoxin WrbA